MERDFRTVLTDAALKEGFPLAGALDIDLGLAALSAHVDRYDDWLKAGYSGEMSYLVRGRDRRADPKLVFPGAKSILCVAIPYPRGPAGAPEPESGPRYARYLQGGDYHTQLAEKLERAMQAAADEWQALGHRRPEWKVCVDTSAVLERSWAALAGLGWIGKNTLLIHPKLGSYLFLAEALIDTETGYGPTPIPSFCGNCTRCLDTCPTQAIVAPGRLDSNRCIAYLTLEKRGKLELPTEVRNGMSNWVAGCDLCQEACPFNLKPARSEALENREADAGATSITQWKSLLTETEASYKARVSHSALKRVKPQQFRRNLAIAITNSAREIGPEKRAAFVREILPEIEKWLSAETDEAARMEWDACMWALRVWDR